MILTHKRTGCVAIKSTRKTKQTRRSKYDLHKERITEWCQAGIPLKTMAVWLGDGFTWQGLDQYIRARGLREKTLVYETRNHCDGCEHCRNYINTNGRVGRLCSLSWRTIQKGVICCPTWCEKENEIRVRYGTDGKGNTERDSELHTEAAAEV